MKNNHLESRGRAMNTQRLIASILIALVVLWALPAGAEWSNDPTENNPVCTALYNQSEARVVMDGVGGAIIAWRDYRTEDDIDIYIQRVDESGNELWTSDGIPVCTGNGIQRTFASVSDGSGGAIVCWYDKRTEIDNDVYAQRVDASGTVVWDVNGATVSSTSGNQYLATLVSDGLGGAIITWQDYRSGQGDIYAQRLDTTGNPLWTADGIPVCAASGYQYSPQLTSDGAGGAIIAWYDTRPGSNSMDVYAQKIDASGTAAWTTNGVAICTAEQAQNTVQLAYDGSGGAIIVWQDNRSFNYDVYSQRLDAFGSAFWTSDGLPICTATGDQINIRLIVDDTANAIITWEDNRSGAADIYAQRVDAAGNVLWTTDGAVVCAGTGEQEFVELIGDGAGGGIFTWKDTRDLGGGHIYAQRLDESGSALWAVDGTAVCTAPVGRSNPVLVENDAGGAIIAWADERTESTNGTDIYSQHIGPHGHLGDMAVTITEVIDYPDDQGGVVVMSWTPSFLDQFLHEIVTHYAVWRRIPDPGVWAHVEDVPAYYLDEYASDAPTYETYSGSGEIPWTEYKVVAHTDNPLVFWESEVVSGYSVDNLAPGAPLNLTGTPSGMDILLTWTASGHHDEDLAFYRVYRSDVSGFTPDLSNHIGTSAVTSYIDSNPGAGTWFYLVTAEDINGNEGLPSNEASSAGGPVNTISASLACNPQSGTLPFMSWMTLTLTNLYEGQSRRFACHIDVTLGRGQYFPHWRNGYMNAAPGEIIVVEWDQLMPALGSVRGENNFVVFVEDVTPAPYNQPPYPPSGDTASTSCTITGLAP